MDLELDHFFILTDKPRQAGDLLVSLGLKEGFSRDHAGQGTSNRRFEFSNGMLEILYLRDSEEATLGPARNLRFPERIESDDASPFGIILSRVSDSGQRTPFAGWSYQPDYFDPPKAFHVGDNSEILAEPLCIYVPFIPPVNRPEEPGKFTVFSRVEVTVPLVDLSPTLRTVGAANRLQVATGSEHLAVLTLDHGATGLFRDLRPDLPLIVHW